MKKNLLWHKTDRPGLAQNLVNGLQHHGFQQSMADKCQLHKHGNGDSPNDDDNWTSILMNKKSTQSIAILYLRSQ